MKFIIWGIKAVATNGLCGAWDKPLAVDDNTDLFDPVETMHCLESIAQSPDREHGGFHPQTAKIARSALKYIGDLRAEIEQLKSTLEWFEHGPGKGGHHVKNTDPIRDRRERH